MYWNILDGWPLPQGSKAHQQDEREQAGGKWLHGLFLLEHDDGLVFLEDQGSGTFAFPCPYRVAWCLMSLPRRAEGWRVVRLRGIEPGREGPSQARRIRMYLWNDYHNQPYTERAAAEHTRHGDRFCTNYVGVHSFWISQRLNARLKRNSACSRGGLQCRANLIENVSLLLDLLWPTWGAERALDVRDPRKTL